MEDSYFGMIATRRRQMERGCLEAGRGSSEERRRRRREHVGLRDEMRREVAPRPGLSRLIDKARRLAMTFLLSTLVASHRARASIAQVQAAHRRALALRAVALLTTSPTCRPAPPSRTSGSR